MNSVTITGRLTHEADGRNLGTDRAVTRLRVAVNEPGPADATCYVDVVTFKTTADAAAQHLIVGQRIAVTGHLHPNEWDDPDGGRRQRHEVIAGAYGLDFLDKPRNANGDDD